MISTPERCVLLVSLTLAGCGGGLAGEGNGRADRDAGSPAAAGGGADVSSPPASVELFPVTKGDEVGLIAFDSANVYAAIFSSASANGDLCSWKSRWIRVAKEGGAITELGDAATCVFYLNATAVVIDGALYWLAHETSSGADQVAVLMTMPTSGGPARRVNKYDRDFVELATDGASLFVVDSGTSAAEYTDGAVLRLGTNGAPATLAEKQAAAQLVGVIGGSVVWTARTDCSLGASDCASTTFNSVPAGGGSARLIAKRPLLGSWPTTTSDGAIYYFASASTVERLSLDGNESTFLSVPWQGAGFVSIDRLRIGGDEVIASGDSSPDMFLMAEPRRYDPPFIQSAVFEVEGGYVYAQRDDAFKRLPVP